MLMLIISILAIHHASAQISDNLQNNVDKLNEAGDLIIDEDVRNEFIQKKWTEFNQKSRLTYFLNSTEDKLKVADPVWKIAVGDEFSWSFKFILMIFFWFFFFSNLTKIMELFTDVQLTKELLSIGLVVAISAIGVNKAIAETSINIISKIPYSIFQFLAYFGLIILLGYFSLYTKHFEKSLKAIKEKKANRETRKEVKEMRKDLQKLKTSKNKDSEKLKKIKDEDDMEKLVRSEFEGISDDDEF